MTSQASRKPGLPIVYVDMDDVMCDYRGAVQAARRASPEVRIPQSVPGFFESLAPIEGAIDAVNHLRQSVETFVLTAPSTRNPHSYAEKRIWVEKHFDYVFTKRLIISPDKGLLKGDYLIDDQPRGKGQDRFGGTLIQFGAPPYPDWVAVMGHFIERGLLDPTG